MDESCAPECPRPDIPRWKQVYEFIEQRIADGEYPPGSRLPGVLAIQGEFGIAQMTARPSRSSPSCPCRNGARWAGPA
ncbi:hypothetical protein DMH12_38265 [Streptomyces sp. WAC 04229]|uniref:GntR family transcriptional regulator n=1 Tax=Streptomyces sp. WAC 04229 TaxID=2203206 RepID=UPI000F73BA77|nr:GntR family transcriptional regulator [Streptomyces sp. WAC 04229]RSN35442.1 hypothetical protein DMH12_38265 [Streptomyces sp. WAC 04229]